MKPFSTGRMSSILPKAVCLGGDDFTTFLTYFINERKTHTHLEEDEPPEGVTEHDDEEHVREIAAQEE